MKQPSKKGGQTIRLQPSSSSSSSRRRRRCPPLPTTSHKHCLRAHPFKSVCTVLSRCCRPIPTAAVEHCCDLRCGAGGVASSNLMDAWCNSSWVQVFFKKVRPTLGFRRFGQVPGLLVRWSLGPLVPWSLVPWSSGPWVLWVFDTLFRGLLEIVPSCRQSVCKLGGLRPPQPPRSCTRPRQVSSCQQKQNPYGPSQNP